MDAALRRPDHHWRKGLIGQNIRGDGGRPGHRRHGAHRAAQRPSPWAGAAREFRTCTVRLLGVTAPRSLSGDQPPPLVVSGLMTCARCLSFRRVPRLFGEVVDDGHQGLGHGQKVLIGLGPYVHPIMVQVSPARPERAHPKPGARARLDAASVVAPAAIVAWFPPSIDATPVTSGRWPDRRKHFPIAMPTTAADWQPCPGRERMEARTEALAVGVGPSGSYGEHVMVDPADKSGSRDVEGPQDPLVERVRPEPSRPPAAGVTLNGLLGDSDRAGRRRLYFTGKLDYFVEFSVEDVLHSLQIPSDRAPFLGTPATQITLKKGADVDYTHTMKARPPDEFDLDLRRGPPRIAGSGDTGGTAYSCYECDTDLRGQCHTQGFYTCTCASMTCDTCYETGCSLPTCESTCGGCLPKTDIGCDKTQISCVETACSPLCHDI